MKWFEKINSESDAEHILLKAPTESKENEIENLQKTLEGLAETDRRILKEKRDSGQTVPSLTASGVRYAPVFDPFLSDINRALEMGRGDVDTLACWRVAELREAGEKADPVLIATKGPTGTRYTVKVRRADGTLEDIQELLKTR